MGEAADDARERHDFWDELEMLHDMGECEDDCPFCYTKTFTKD